MRRCFTVRMKRHLGGSGGNEQLTAVVATLLLVLLAVEGATLLDLGRWLTVHAFVGMLLIPVRRAQAGQRRLADGSVLPRPGGVRAARPAAHAVLRTLVAPVIVASTIALFATGVALLALDRTQRHDRRAAQGELRRLARRRGRACAHAPAQAVERLAAARPRSGVAAGSRGRRRCVAGFAVATLTLPAADQLQDGVSAHIGVDER